MSWRPVLATCFSTGCPALLAHAFHDILQELENAPRPAGWPVPRLLAVSKRQPAVAVASLAALGQHAFGENYVQEALAKQAELCDPSLQWHLIGHLQSNKAGDAARAFDWVQSLDRLKLVAALARQRPDNRAPLNVLVQVNIDDETSKHGCRPQDIATLAAAVAAEPRLQLRGLMAIPAPDPDPRRRRAAFAAMRALYDALASQYAGIDTLSMGMSDDFPLAVAEGATLVRVGTALFGHRSPDPRNT